jgi:hypothetical protein
MCEEIIVNEEYLNAIHRLIVNNPTLGYDETQDFIQDAIQRFIRIRKYGVPKKTCLESES